jgi:aspartyl-tRNA(Asn)/glutamyl-tRNA(Gln) amidotransferase subunit A
MHDLTAAEASRHIRAGSLSATAYLNACLDRIDACEPAIAAWVHLDRERARHAAQERDWEIARGQSHGALHGVPVALKDNIDVAGVPTTAGVGPFAHRTPAIDAPVVARLRAQGAVILGKVSTTAFAFLDPSPTRNPWNLAHTPGGSSSGSAAAVAARMVPLALGTQTIGSVLRPAAYCGIVGFKPTYGRISTAGVVPLAWSLDHVGVFSRSVEDATFAVRVLAGTDDDDLRADAVPLKDGLAGLVDPPAPRLGFLRSLLERTTPEMSAHLETVMQTLRHQGASVVEVDLPPSFGDGTTALWTAASANEAMGRAAHAVAFAGIHDAARAVMQAEAAAAHHDLFATNSEEFPPKIRLALEGGQAIPAVAFLRAQEVRKRFRAEATATTMHYDALLLPTVGAPAPKGLESTGDPYFCAPWTAAGMPAIALPSGLAVNGLPLSIQLVGAPYADTRLLAAAAWCERVFAFDRQPSACPRTSEDFRRIKERKHRASQGAHGDLDQRSGGSSAESAQR